jgi:exodeoxyribonuclease III
MKIAAFNINNIRRRLPNLLDWMRETSPDVVCLQELKATDAEFPVTAIQEAGYEAICRGQKTWNGVAILSRVKPIQTLSDLPGAPDDKQSRYIEAAVNGIVVASLYAPNGNPQPGPKFDYKLAWLRRLSVHAAELLAARVPVVLAGDYNVVPTDQDIYPSKSWDKDALVQPASRAAFSELTKQGWVDAVRALHPSEPMYTFWHYLRNRWQRNAGLRIDHVLLSPPAADRLKAAGVDRAVRGQPDASDHAPVWVELSDQNVRRRRPRAGGKSSPSSRGRGQTASGPTRPSHSRPLLVIDGDSFAHRAYHALPKTIRRGTARVRERSLALPTFCFGFTRPSSRGPSSWGGIRWKSPRNAMRNSLHTKVDVNSTMSCWTSSTFCLSSWQLAAFRTRRRPGMRRTTFWRQRLRPRSEGMARRWWRAVTVTHSSWRPISRRYSTPSGPAR